jgi:cytochrome c oxidase cbb3-type subunit I
MTANETIHPTAPAPEIDASCRLPLLALLVGASVWLLVGTVLALVGSIKFHAPDFLADCPMLTYGRVVAAANDALVYGFCLPAALAVILWIFARLSQTVYTLPLVPVVAAHIWHLGVFVGLVSILLGSSTGFPWLEFPRGGSILLFVAFVLIAIPTVASFGYRLETELYPSHWFLLAALLWFPWSYASANIFLVSMPVRGVAQAVVNLWFADNLLYVWFSLVGLGVAFYFLPKLTGQPLHTYFYSLYVFWTLALFGTWCGMPQGSPFPAWITSLSFVASVLLIVPVLGVVVIYRRTLSGAASGGPLGSPLSFIKFGLVSFVVSSLMYITLACPQMSRVLEFTWFGQAQVQLQIWGFLAAVLFGALYYILPLALGFAFKFPGFARAHFILLALGVLLWVLPLAFGGYKQGVNGYSLDAALPWLRISTLGLGLILVGNLLFAINVLALFVTWKLNLVKTVFAVVTAPLKATEVKL